MKYIVSSSLPFQKSTKYGDGSVVLQGVSFLSYEYITRDEAVKRRKPSPLTASSWTQWKNSRNTRTDSPVSYGTKSRYVTSTVHTLFPVGDGIYPKQAGNYQQWVSIQTTNYTALENECRVQFRETHLNLGLLIAEYPQTCQMFKDYSSRILEASIALTGIGHNKNLELGLLDYRATRAKERSSKLANLSKRDAKRNRRALVEQLKRIAKAQKAITRRAAKEHLAIVYGVIPLMSDMNQAVMDLRKPPNTASRSLKAKASRTTKFSCSESERHPEYEPDFAHREFFVSQSTYVRAEAVAYNSDLKAYLGNWGLTNPASLIWEKIPFSFVVDWFINIGEVLGSLDNAFYTTACTAQRGEIRRQRFSSAWRGAVATSSILNTFRSSSYAMSQVAGFVYKPGISLTHIANGLSLLRRAKG